MHKIRNDKISQYYNSTKHSEVRSDLTYAVKLVDRIKNTKTVIDVGCGAGSNIDYLLRNNFTVHAFDIEKKAIEICKKRFEKNENVSLSQESFNSFEYPKVSLVVADASLFFCPRNEFANVWTKISKSLISEGIFCGSFLGPEDTMATPNEKNGSYWSNTLVFNDAKEVRSIFKGYKIHQFTEHKSSGLDPQGEPHNWHIFSVVAEKEMK